MPEWQRDENGAWFYYDSAGNAIYGTPTGTSGFRTGAAAPAPATPAAPVRAPVGSWGRPAGFTAPSTAPAAPAAPAAPTAPAPPRRSSRELIARLHALVASGIVNPAELLDETGHIRPDVLTRADAIGPYTGPQAGDVGGAGGLQVGEGGDVFVNPAELTADTAAFTAAEGARAGLAGRSGTYFDPATNTWRVTAAQGNALLDRFGNARIAEENYQRQVQQGTQQAGDLQQRGARAAGDVEGLQARLQQARSVLNDPASFRPTDAYGHPNPIVEEAKRTVALLEPQIGPARAAANDALLSYNRARGAADTFAANRPTTVNELAQGMTGAQFGQYSDAMLANLTPEERDQLMNSGGLQTYGRPNPRQRAALTYRQAAMARGVL